MSQRGFTVYELMVSLVLVGVLSGLCATIAASARETERMGRAYAEDLRHLRDAADTLAATVRGARSVTWDGTDLHVDGTAWNVADGALRRDGEVVVRGLSRLEAARIEDGAWRLGVAPQARRAGAHAPALVITARQRPEAAR
jgi:prepilin-type N-terminal cleavage/methylation domain-containing protein